MIRFLQQKLFALWLFLTDARYRRILQSGLFDGTYYLTAYPDLAQLVFSPLVHYLRTGWREGRKPNPYFDPRYYSRQYLVVNEIEDEPLDHYIREGWRLGNAPGVYFLPDYYRQQAPALTGSVGNPLAHYLHHGRSAGRKPSPYFDPDYYLHVYPDVSASGVHPVDHYEAIGAGERRRPSPFFDVVCYIDKTPVLADLSYDLVVHYMKFGAGEGKSPLPLFDPLFYRKQYPDAAGAADPFIHYLTLGLAEDRRPSSWFDPVFYRQTILDPVGADTRPLLQHYLDTGVHERRYPDGRVRDLARKPLISLVVPVYNVEASYLNNCIRSVVYQAYPHWELCLADDCSSQTHVRKILEDWTAKDDRIKVVCLGENVGISGASNAAAAMATGEYLAFLDNDDELTVDCLFQVVKTICETDGDLLYSDEDLIGADGTRFSVFHKPGYNCELLLCHNYITHLVVTLRSLFHRVGGFDPQYNGAQDYDLVLKLSEQARRVVHIPQIIYHWRASETSTSINHDQKSYADAAGRSAVHAAVQRRGISAEVLATDWKFYYRVRRELGARPFVSLLICWNRNPANAGDWLRSLAALTRYDGYEIVLMVPSSGFSEVSRQIEPMTDRQVVCLEIPEGLEPAAAYNHAVSRSRGEYLVFLDCRVTVTVAEWLETLLAQAMEAGTGVVAARLRNDSDNDAGRGVVPDCSLVSPQYYIDFFHHCSSRMNGLHCSQGTLAVPWELCALARELYEVCAGFDGKTFPLLFWGLDFCLRARAQGYENIYLSCELAEKTDTETKLDQEVEIQRGVQELAVFQERWKFLLLQGDPYYNLGVLEDHQCSVEDFKKWYVGWGNPVSC